MHACEHMSARRGTERERTLQLLTSVLHFPLLSLDSHILWTLLRLSCPPSICSVLKPYPSLASANAMDFQLPFLRACRCVKSWRRLSRFMVLFSIYARVCTAAGRTLAPPDEQGGQERREEGAASA